MLLGPVFRHELTRTSRRRGFYAMRSLLGLIVLWALVITRQGYPDTAGWPARYDDPRSLPWLATMLFLYPRPFPSDALRTVTSDVALIAPFFCRRDVLD